MSNEKQETIADIAADIRAQNLGLPEDSYALSPLVGDLLSFARRIEVANAREREASAEAAQICGEIGEMVGREEAKNQSVTNCNRFGNAAKMREALKQIHDLVNSLDEECAVDPVEVRDIARTALASTPRNCDVGTAEEQWKRFDRFCDKYDDCTACPLFRGGCLTQCFARWAQLPYEEGGENGK